jgi:hypothetical protein
MTEVSPENELSLNMAFTPERPADPIIGEASAPSTAFNLSAKFGPITVVRPFSSVHINGAGQHVPGYNENNPGVGLSIPINRPGAPSLNLEIGAYVNS